MRTIQRTATDRISIRECKELILGRAPLVRLGELHATIDERSGRPIGPIEHRVIEGVNAFERDIHDEFFLILQQLNIKPRHMLSPSDTNYRNAVGSRSCYDVPELPASPGVDGSYAVSHEEFVRIADAFGSQVVVTKLQERGAESVTAATAVSAQAQGGGASGTPLMREAPAARRARWLEMLEAEERVKKRGALTRLANSEGVDRSNMGKDIAKARAERQTQRRDGGWGSQLVQDGKRIR